MFRFIFASLLLLLSATVFAGGDDFIGENAQIANINGYADITADELDNDDTFDLAVFSSPFELSNQPLVVDVVPSSSNSQHLRLTPHQRAPPTANVI
ncbi:hypothetical protein [Colwellia sp. MEBiC06753]